MEEKILIPSFDAGMHLQFNPLLVKENEALIAKNVDLDEIGTLRKCKGYSVFCDQPTTDEVLALYSFYKMETPVTRYLLRDSGGEVYKSNFTTGKWDGITGTTTLSKTKKPTWLTYKNLAIRFNGVDNPKKYDGTTFSDLGGSPLNGDVACLYKDRIYVAGVSPNFSTLYWSDVGETEVWPKTNNSDVNNNDGDRIMALVPLFDSLIVFKEYSMWEWQVDRLNNPTYLRYITKEIGTTPQRSVVNINGIVYFFNRKGIWMLAQKYPELISLKVDKFIKQISDPYSVEAFVDGNKYCLYIGDVEVDGRIFKNTILVYDTLYDQWTIKCLEHKVSCSTSFIGSDNVLRIYLGSNDGYTFLWNDGYSFAGKPIEMEYETATFQPGDPRWRKTFKEILVRTGRNPLSVPEIVYCVDDGNWVSVGMASETYSQFPIADRNKPGRGRESGKDIKLSIHEVSDREMVPIYEIVIYYEQIKTEL